MNMATESPTSPTPVVGRRIIPPDQIAVQEEIGEGEFGVVKRAVYTNDIGQKVQRWLLDEFGHLYLGSDGIHSDCRSTLP